MKIKDSFILPIALGIAFLAWMIPESKSQPSAAVPYKALNTNSFTITQQIVSVRNFGTFGGSNTFITNLYVTNLYVSNIITTNLTVNSNLFVSNVFVTNIDASTIITTNLYVTNIFNTFLVTSNIIAGNINGTTNTLAMFTPDSFSVGDSIVTQPDTNTIVVNGSGTGYIQLGGTNGEQVVFGTGATNLLTRNLNRLWYQGADLTGPTVYPGLAVTNATEGSSAVYGAGGNIAAIYGDSGVGLLDSLTSSPREVRWFNNYFAPTKTNSFLGSDENYSLYPWGSINARTNMVWGFKDIISTNYSRIVTYQSSTNDPFVIDFQSSGTAGESQDLFFKSNGVPIAKILSLSQFHIGGGNSDSAPSSSIPGITWMNPDGSSSSSGIMRDGTAAFGVIENSVQVLRSTSSALDVSTNATIGWSRVPGFYTSASYLALTNSDSSGVGDIVVRPGPNDGLILTVDGPAILRGITKAQKTAIASPKNGMIVYQTDNTPGFRVYVSGTWFMLPTVADP